MVQNDHAETTIAEINSDTDFCEVGRNDWAKYTLWPSLLALAYVLKLAALDCKEMNNSVGEKTISKCV